MRELGAFLRQGFVVEFLRLFWVEAEVELKQKLNRYI